MKKFKSTFRLFITYAFCIVIPIVSIVLLGNMLIQDFRKNIISSKQTSIEKAFEKVQNEIEDLENVADYIGKSELVSAYVYDAMKDGRYLLENYQEIIEMLRLFKTGRDIAEIYLYDSRQNRIITTSAAFSEAEYFFKYNYCIEKLTEEYYDRLGTVSAKMEYSPVMPVVVNDKSVQVIEGSVTIPVNMVKSYPLKLIIAIDAEKFLGDLYYILEEESEFNVYNENDELIFSSGDYYESVMDLTREQKITSVQNGDDHVYGTVLLSQDGRFKLEVYMPDMAKWSGGEFSIPKAWGLAVGSIVVSIVFCAYFTLKNYFEIQNIMSLFVKWTEKGAEEDNYKEHISYETIKKYVDKLVNERIAFKEQTEQFNELKRKQILNKLIYDEKGEIINNQIDDELGIRDSKNVVLCIRYGNSDYRKFITTEVTIKDVVQLFLKENVDRELEIFDTSARETVCIVFGMEEGLIDTLIRGVTESLYGEIYRELGIKIMIGVGNIVESVYDIGTSYKQAKEVIHYQNVTGRSVFLYSELMQFTDDYYYPQELNEKIYNYMVAGKNQEAKELIVKIFERNISKNSQMITISALERLKRRLLDVLISLGEKFDISTGNIASQLSQEQNIESFFAMFNDFLDIFSEEIRRKERKLEDSMAAKIMDYLKLNYMDGELSVSKISEQLGYQKDYMSKMFKAEYGENLSVTIEKFRIEKACELLKSDMKITDIPQEVGYNSDMSFRRAFKKITGVTPAEYKKIN